MNCIMGRCPAIDNKALSCERFGGECGIRVGLHSPTRSEQLRDALKAGKVADERLEPHDRRAFLRGWNEGVAFAEMQVDKIFGKVPGDVDA